MAAADTVKAFAHKAQTFVLSKWRDFREESPYFQAKFALVGAWVVVSLFTVAIVPPPTIPFVVEQQVFSFGLSQKTALLIFNADGGDLDAAVVEITGTVTDYAGRKTSGTWRTKPVIIAEGLKTTLSTESFSNDKGENPAYEINVENVRILDDGDEVYNGPPSAPTKPERRR